MKILQAVGVPVEFECDGLVLGLGADWKTSRYFSAIDDAMGGVLRKLIDSGELSTKPMKLSSFQLPSGMKAKQLTVVGLGDLDARDAGVGFRAAATAAKSMAGSKKPTMPCFCRLQRR